MTLCLHFKTNFWINQKVKTIKASTQNIEIKIKKMRFEPILQID